jgi:prenylated cyclic peptide (anacyclamide/piricyclamide family)
MKKKSLRPQIVAPVQRQTTATTTSTGVGVGALTYCDIATRQCTPFAGDGAE